MRKPKFQVGDVVKTDIDGPWKTVRIAAVNTAITCQSGIAYKAAGLKTSADGWVDEAWFQKVEAAA
jgi:hypothetical protein